MSTLPNIDDVFGEDTGEHPTVSREEQVRALREVVRVAQEQRLPPIEVVVEPAGQFDVLGEIEDGSESARAVPPVTSLPLLQRLFRKFASSAPRPRTVRVDTESSYAVWKNQRKEPYAAELARAIEERDAQDGLDAEEHAKRIERAKLRLEECGQAVPLSLPPHAKDKIDCWQEGDEIFASVRTRGPDGKPRIITSSTEAPQHAEQVVGYASDAGVDPFAVVGVLPALAQVLGGGQLVAQLCRAAPLLARQPDVVAGRVFVGVVRPVSSPAVAAMMALAQRAQSGDMQARTEISRVAATTRGQKLLEEATRRLAAARNKESV